MSKQPQSKKTKTKTEFQRFEELTRSLINVSNAEVREKMAAEKSAKQARKQKTK
jgi:hypothetical protein